MCIARVPGTSGQSRSADEILRVMTVSSFAGALTPWTPEVSAEIVGVNGFLQFVLSTDPSLTYSLLNNPSADSFVESVLFVHNQNGGFFQGGMKIPIDAGRKYFFAMNLSDCPSYACIFLDNLS